MHTDVQMHSYSYESEGDDEEEQKTDDGMLSSAVCRKSRLVYLKGGLSFE